MRAGPTMRSGTCGRSGYSQQCGRQSPGALRHHPGRCRATMWIWSSRVNCWPRREFDMSSEQSTQPQASDRAGYMPKGEMRSAGNAGMPKGEMRRTEGPRRRDSACRRARCVRMCAAGCRREKCVRRGRPVSGRNPALPGTQGPGATRPYANDTLATNASSSPGGGTLREYAQSTATSGADPIGASVRVGRPTEARTSHGTARGKARSNTP